jgi:hypothetical protein
LQTLAHIAAEPPDEDCESRSVPSAVLSQPFLEPQHLHMLHKFFVALVEVFGLVWVELHLVVHLLVLLPGSTI